MAQEAQRGGVLTLPELQVQKLNFSYGQTRILKDISFSVEGGEFIGLVGPNGSGKTTLLRCISRTISNDSGKVILSGTEITSLKQRDIARIVAVVPQGGSVEFGFNVRDIVLMGRHPHQNRFTFETSADSEIVDSVLKLTNTWQFRDKQVTKLSGGEFQRVLIARALAQKPRILLLDEPTAHLDISHQLEIMDIISKLNKKHCITLLGVFHDLNLAARYCKRLLILHRGKLMEDGALEEVLTPSILSRVFNINSVIRRNPVTNNLFIDPIDTIKPSPDAKYLDKKNMKAEKKHEKRIEKSKIAPVKIHLVCGAGSGTVLMKKLIDEGFELSAGVLNVLDQDNQTAQALNIPVIREAAFSPISQKSHKMNLEMIIRADFVILSNVPIGPANKLNLDSVERAYSKGKKVILFEPDKTDRIDNRDFTDGEATKIYNKIKPKSKIVNTLEELIKVIK
jgi:iron complex transport system ATP-binding protein